MLVLGVVWVVALASATAADDGGARTKQVRWSAPVAERRAGEWVPLAAAYQPGAGLPPEARVGPLQFVPQGSEPEAVQLLYVPVETLRQRQQQQQPSFLNFQQQRTLQVQGSPFQGLQQQTFLLPQKQEKLASEERLQQQTFLLPQKQEKLASEELLQQANSVQRLTPSRQQFEYQFKATQTPINEQKDDASEEDPRPDFPSEIRSQNLFASTTQQRDETQSVAKPRTLFQKKPAVAEEDGAESSASPAFVEQTTPTPQRSRQPPHQPPLSIFLGGGDTSLAAVIGALRSADTVAVLENAGPNAPRLFVGPSELATPAGYGKFDLPYLSPLDGNRVERKVDQMPFFVAPLSFKPPAGYAKIPFPPPHVGSIVVTNVIPRGDGLQYKNLPPINPQLPTLVNSLQETRKGQQALATSAPFVSSTPDGRLRGQQSSEEALTSDELEYEQDEEDPVVDVEKPVIRSQGQESLRQSFNQQIPQVSEAAINKQQQEQFFQPGRGRTTQVNTSDRQAEQATVAPSRTHSNSRPAEYDTTQVRENSQAVRAPAASYQSSFVRQQDSAAPSRQHNSNHIQTNTYLESSRQRETTHSDRSPGLSTSIRQQDSAVPSRTHFTNQVQTNLDVQTTVIGEGSQASRVPGGSYIANSGRQHDERIPSRTHTSNQEQANAHFETSQVGRTRGSAFLTTSDRQRDGLLQSNQQLQSTGNLEKSEVSSTAGRTRVGSSFTASSERQQDAPSSLRDQSNNQDPNNVNFQRQQPVQNTQVGRTRGGGAFYSTSDRQRDYQLPSRPQHSQSLGNAETTDNDQFVRTRDGSFVNTAIKDETPAAPARTYDNSQTQTSNDFEPNQSSSSNQRGRVTGEGSIRTTADRELHQQQHSSADFEPAIRNDNSAINHLGTFDRERAHNNKPPQAIDDNQRYNDPDSGRSQLGQQQQAIPSGGFGRQSVGTEAFRQQDEQNGPLRTVYIQQVADGGSIRTNLKQDPATPEGYFGVNSNKHVNDGNVTPRSRVQLSDASPQITLTPASRTPEQVYSVVQTGAQESSQEEEALYSRVTGRPASQQQYDIRSQGDESYGQLPRQEYADLPSQPVETTPRTTTTTTSTTTTTTTPPPRRGPSRGRHRLNTLTTSTTTASPYRRTQSRGRRPNHSRGRVQTTTTTTEAPYVEPVYEKPASQYVPTTTTTLQGILNPLDFATTQLQGGLQVIQAEEQPQRFQATTEADSYPIVNQQRFRTRGSQRAGQQSRTGSSRRPSRPRVADEDIVTAPQPQVTTQRVYVAPTQEPIPQSRPNYYQLAESPVSERDFKQQNEASFEAPVRFQETVNGEFQQPSIRLPSEPPSPNEGRLQLSIYQQEPQLAPEVSQLDEGFLTTPKYATLNRNVETSYEEVQETTPTSTTTTTTTTTTTSTTPPSFIPKVGRTKTRGRGRPRVRPLQETEPENYPSRLPVRLPPPTTPHPAATTEEEEEYGFIRPIETIGAPFRAAESLPARKLVAKARRVGTDTSTVASLPDQVYTIRPTKRPTVEAPVIRLTNVRGRIRRPSKGSSSEATNHQGLVLNFQGYNDPEGGAESQWHASVFNSLPETEDKPLEEQKNDSTATTDDALTEEPNNYTTTEIQEVSTDSTDAVPTTDLPSEELTTTSIDAENLTTTTPSPSSTEVTEKIADISLQKPAATRRGTWVRVRARKRPQDILDVAESQNVAMVGGTNVISTDRIEKQEQKTLPVTDEERTTIPGGEKPEDAEGTTRLTEGIMGLAEATTVSETVPPEEVYTLPAAVFTPYLGPQLQDDLVLTDGNLRGLPLEVSTSTSTEISHETEICYRGRCIKTKSLEPDQLLTL